MELENEIRYMNRPLGQAFFSLSQSKKGRVFKFIKKVCEIQKKKEINMETAWHDCLEEFRFQWPLHQEEWDMLFCIGEVLGKSDKESQRAFILMMCEKFRMQEKKAEEERVCKDKLYKNLGVLGGLAMVLVLI